MGILDRIAGTLDELTGGDGDGDDVERARALVAEGDPAGAEVLLSEAARRAPRAAAVFLALGQLRLRRSALEPAVEAYGRAVDLAAGDAEAWIGLGETLVRLGRAEPARDSLRRALTLAVEPALRARAHAGLGRLHAVAGRWAQAARELGKAIELGGASLTDESGLALDYGRALARLGEAEASEWLTRAARAPGAEPAIFAEAAATARDGARAEALLREGLARAPADLRLRAELIRLLGRQGRTDEALALSETVAAEAPDDPRAWAALREASTAAGRWMRAAEAAARESRLGAPPPLAARIGLALGAEDSTALAEISRPPDPTDDPQVAADRAALAALVDRRAQPEDLLRLGRLAPGEAARRFLARTGAPPLPPAGQLASLLTWAEAFAAGTPPLGRLAAEMGRAAVALDRPLLVAVMGEFNAGKSSFVNAFCGEEIAPTGVTPTTATVNVLRFGPKPETRVVYQDGSSRAIPPGAAPAFLGGLRDDDARDVRLVEIFLPVEALRRVEIVDTPGLNSLRPEHERAAREFLRNADAIVWVLAVGQAAKATEREALGTAHAAGKRVIGVLNKIDRVDPAEAEAVVRHVERALGELVNPVVPFSATEVLAARRAGRVPPAWQALDDALERRFFAEARALKRATALGALGRFVEAGRAIVQAAAPPAPEMAQVRPGLGELRRRLGGALDGERVALRARIEAEIRRAAVEVREFVQPRAWLFGERRATPDDEAFLAELLEDATARAIDRTGAALGGAIAAGAGEGTGPDPLGDVRARARGAVAAALDRFAAFARGVIVGGAVPDFFRHQLPRLRPEVAAIAEALGRHLPDPEEALFAELKRRLDAVFRAAEAELAIAEADAATRAAIHDECLERPLGALEAELASIGSG